MLKRKRIAEYRANSKGLVEQRNDKAAEMQTILDAAKAETRAMNTEEIAKFTALEKEIAGIDATIKAEERARTLNLNVVDTKKKEETRAELEERAFANYIRGVVEQRADVNFTTGDNGAVLPSSIANKIIEKVYDICPIFELSTRYNVGGTLSIPYYDETTQQITMAYADEFVDLESKAGKFTSISLSGFLAGALTKVSKKLLNNSNFALVDFVIKKVAEAAKKWVENELLNGTTNKIAGLTGVTQIITAASATVIVADELIDVQEEVPDEFQDGAIWIMNRATRKAIRKLKDGDGTYLLQKDFNAKWGYTLLGKDVYTTNNISTMAAGKTVIFYGDMSGLATKVSEDVSVEVLREKYATQHAIGVVAWMEIDAKVENAQKISKLVMKAS
jgi:HK97 family phage major capsid protein